MNNTSPNAPTPSIATLIESVKDLITGDKCAEIGLNDWEPKIERAVNSYPILVGALENGQSLADLIAGKYDMPDEAAQALAEWAMQARAALFSATKAQW